MEVKISLAIFITYAIFRNERNERKDQMLTLATVWFLCYHATVTTSQSCEMTAPIRTKAECEIYTRGQFAGIGYCIKAKVRG